ncbi:hypothetical protein GSI_12164 [Ganoderma sinense ZZ0214-1]|uniref:DUF6532 domain-containing protein n=1 Tax=Ganoderma sinense ZZ0214-1 TaxID=1077348 RepID=A0A2G8RY43_9APHY|nr:hypothetical protein GSI_12160 [Ganoderma sinense ZZ0214-1]PIL26405.1 hypothetical protein GSI_12162 [Ganoderma sinense ZZ0214-1]PIL26407.1 hypothetical protein GSI_12164 [Ganoderma sinense ZZ0214-1]
MGRGSGGRSVEDDHPTTQRSPRPVRRATQKPPVWEDMIPKERKSKTNRGDDGKDGKKKAVKDKSKSKEKTRAPQRSVASQFQAPSMNTNTSEDEAVGSETAAGKTTKFGKSPKADSTVESEGKPAKKNKGKSRQIIESSSSSGTDSSSDEGDDEEEDESSSSGLEDLEKKDPGALKAKFDGERPAWVDDDPQPYSRQKDPQDESQDNYGFDDQQDGVGSPSGPSFRSPAGSPAPSPLRVNQALIISQSRSRSRSHSYSHSNSRSDSRPRRPRSRSGSRPHPRSRSRSHSRSPRPAPRSSRSRSDPAPAAKHARDESSDEGLKQAPPAKKKGKTSHVGKTPVKTNERNQRTPASDEAKARSREKEAEHDRTRRRARELEKEREKSKRKEQVRRHQAREENNHQRHKEPRSHVREDISGNESSADEDDKGRKKMKPREKAKVKEQVQRTHGRQTSKKQMDASRAGPSDAGKERGRSLVRLRDPDAYESTRILDSSTMMVATQVPTGTAPHCALQNVGDGIVARMLSPLIISNYLMLTFYLQDASDLLSESSDDDDNEDPRIDIVWYGSNRPNLTDQYPRVYRVTRRTIRECEPNVCLLNAFPDEDANFARPLLIKHATTLGYKDMVKKLKSNKETDEFYHRKLCAIASQRVNLIRGKVKKACQRQVKTVYGLTVGDSEKITWLLDGIAYIFPHKYEVFVHKDRTVKGEGAFSLPIFEDMLSDAFFSKKGSFGFRIMPRFTSSDPENPEEKEIPAAMLALVSTAIYASIEDYKHAPYEAGKFEVNSYLHVYKQNIAALDAIKTGNLEAYHALLHGLYTRIVGGSARPVSKKSYLNVAGMTRR